MNFVEYLAPYTGEVRTKSFPTYEEAERMAEFYRSCGSPAKVYVQWPEELIDYSL